MTIKVYFNQQFIRIIKMRIIAKKARGRYTHTHTHTHTHTLPVQHSKLKVDR